MRTDNDIDKNIDVSYQISQEILCFPQRLLCIASLLFCITLRTFKAENIYANTFLTHSVHR